MKKLLRFPALVALLVTALTARAQITFTVTATADNTASNVAQQYVPGQAYTFVYGLTAAYPQNANYFPGGNTDWFEKYITTEAQLFTDVRGSGVAATYIDPIETGGSPFSFVRTPPGNFLSLFAGAEAGDIGLTTLAGTTLTHVIASMNLNGPNFTAPANYTNPADYFTAYVGDYPAWGGTVGLYGGGFDGATFQVTNVSISNASAIPEPSTYGALAGLGALGLAVWRRRKSGR